LVLDAYATGHFLALMRAPSAMAKAVQFGPMGEQSRGIDRCLRDTTICQYHIVTLPEELPLRETQELAAQLREESGLPPRVILNKLLQTSLTVADLQKLKPHSKAIQNFADYLKYHLAHQKDMEQQASRIDPKLTTLPLSFEEESWKIIEKMAGALP
jgi:hypothetical protein